MIVVIQTTKEGDPAHAYIWKAPIQTVNDWIQTAMQNDSLEQRYFVIGPISLLGNTPSTKAEIQEVLRKPS